MSSRNRNFKILTLFENKKLEQAIKDLDRTVENDPDESFTESGNALADKTTLYKTLNKAII